MAFDVQESLVQAVVRHLEVAVPAQDALFTGEVVSGWPDWANSAVEFSAGPNISVTPGQHSVELHAPCVVSTRDDPGSADAHDVIALYRVGYAEIPLQVDLWARNKFELHQYSRAVEASFHNDLPYNSGLNLTLTDYFNAKAASMHYNSFQRRDDTVATQIGERRMTWTIRMNVDLFVESAGKTQVSVDLINAIEIGGVVLIDSEDVELPNNISPPVIS